MAMAMAMSLPEVLGDEISSTIILFTCHTSAFDIPVFKSHDILLFSHKCP